MFYLYGWVHFGFPFKGDEHVAAVATERYRTLRAYQRLRDSGCNESGRSSIRASAAERCTGGGEINPAELAGCGIRRDVKTVMDMRRRYPFLG